MLMKRVGWVWLLLVYILTSCSGGQQLVEEGKQLTIVYSSPGEVNKKQLEFIEQTLGNQFPEYSFRYIDIANYAYNPIGIQWRINSVCTTGTSKISSR